MKPWRIDDIPSQRGRVAVVTGATGGLGYETALALAGAGAEVVLVGRDAAKGRVAAARIAAAHPSAVLRFEACDLGSLAAVRQLAARLTQRYASIDLLVNNAGVMAPPTRHATADGFELQFGTNYLSHFALTARLLPALRSAGHARVVNLSSLAHRSGAIHFDDLQGERRYSAWSSYAQSKLAMLMFTFELQRRSDSAGWGLMSLASHPGYAVTGLQSAGPRLGRSSPPLLERIGKLLEPWLAQSAAEGALPTLFAAASPDAQAAAYYGPDGFFEMKGQVHPAVVARQARDEAAAARLWTVSEQLSGEHWPAVALRSAA